MKPRLQHHPTPPVRMSIQELEEEKFRQRHRRRHHHSSSPKHSHNSPRSPNSTHSHRGSLSNQHHQPPSSGTSTRKSFGNFVLSPRARLALLGCSAEEMSSGLDKQIDLLTSFVAPSQILPSYVIKR